MSKWQVEQHDPDYLDGILCDHTIRDDKGAVVAYAFDPEQARLMAAAPRMLDALRIAGRALGNLPATFEYELPEIDAAIAEATKDD